MNNIKHAQALENLLGDFLFNTSRDAEWGPAYWEPWGFTIDDSSIKIIDEEKFLIFLLRWS